LLKSLRVATIYEMALNLRDHSHPDREWICPESDITSINFLGIRVIMTAGRIQDAVFASPVFENSEQEQMAIPLKY